MCCGTLLPPGGTVTTVNRGISVCCCCCAWSAIWININKYIYNPNNEVKGCLSFCMFVPKDLANHWTDLDLHNRVAIYRSREGLYFITILGGRVPPHPPKIIRPKKKIYPPPQKKREFWYSTPPPQVPLNASRVVAASLLNKVVSFFICSLRFWKLLNSI